MKIPGWRMFLTDVLKNMIIPYKGNIKVKGSNCVNCIKTIDWNGLSIKFNIDSINRIAES